MGGRSVNNSCVTTAGHRLQAARRLKEGPQNPNVWRSSTTRGYCTRAVSIDRPGWCRHCHGQYAAVPPLCVCMRAALCGCRVGWLIGSAASGECVVLVACLVFPCAPHRSVMSPYDGRADTVYSVSVLYRSNGRVVRARTVLSGARTVRGGNHDLSMRVSRS